MHDSQTQLPDLERTKFVIEMKPGFDKEVKFSKTVISAISRPGKLCSLGTKGGPETCRTKHVTNSQIQSTHFHFLIYFRQKTFLFKANLVKCPGWTKEANYWEN